MQERHAFPSRCLGPIPGTVQLKVVTQRVIQSVSGSEMVLASKQASVKLANSISTWHLVILRVSHNRSETQNPTLLVSMSNPWPGLVPNRTDFSYGIMRSLHVTSNAQGPSVRTRHSRGLITLSLTTRQRQTFVHWVRSTQYSYATNIRKNRGRDWRM